MDLYTDPGFPAESEVTSTDQGNIPGGLFWTIPTKPENVEVQLSHKKARMHLPHVVTRDFHDIVNDLMHGPFVPAKCSYDVRWSGTIQPYHVQDATNQFRIDGVLDTAIMSCTASVPARGIDFVSDPAATSKTVFAALVKERNGKFFSGGGNDHPQHAPHRPLPNALPHSPLQWRNRGK